MSRMSEKKITIQDIARTAGVSKSTVSRVLNNSTPVNESKRRLVLEAMKGLDFKPNVFARSLAGGCSMTIGVITQKMDSPFFSMVTTGLIDGLTGSDYSPIFVDGQWRPDQQKAAINTLLDRNVDGLVMLGGDLESEVLTGLVGEKPTVIVAKQLEASVIILVSVERVVLIRQLFQGLGCASLLFMVTPLLWNQVYKFDKIHIFGFHVGMSLIESVGISVHIRLIQ